MDKRIFLSSPHMSEEGYEQSYIQEAFDMNWIAPLGKNVDCFEQELSELVGVSYATALNSGTSAIHLALKAAGVKKGDRVFCQSMTFSATANPIVYEGAVPVFIDSERDTWNMSPEALRKAFEKYPDTKFVMVVNLYGIPAKLDEIKAICDEYNAVMIEDAAESLGSMYKGKYTGTYGEYGIFSFNGNKIITTSGGGMLVSNNEDRIKKARFWATQAREAAPWYQHEEIGYNYRLSNICAGIGRGQLKVLKDRVEKKRWIYHYYEEAFKDIPFIHMMPLNDDTSYSNCWLSSIYIDPESGVTPTKLIEALAAENIESRHIWKPMHVQPVFAGCEYFDNGGVSEDIFRNGLCLPSDSKNTEEDMARICEIIRRVCL